MLSLSFCGHFLLVINRSRFDALSGTSLGNHDCTEKTFHLETVYGAYLDEPHVCPNEKKIKRLEDASRNGCLRTVKYLVSQGADTHEQDNALKLASGNGHLNVTKYLVSKGADVHAQDGYALRWASACGHLDVVKYLVLKGADVHARGNFSLIFASGEGHLDVVEYLVSQGAVSHAC